jgi:hypothetical protein
MVHSPITTLHYVISHRISADALDSQKFHLQRYLNALSQVHLVALEKNNGIIIYNDDIDAFDRVINGLDLIVM